MTAPIATKATTLWTLNQARTHLGISDGGDVTQDALVVQVADAVSEFIERYCQRKFVTRSVTEKYSGDGSKVLFLRNFPVTAFTSLTIRRSPTDADSAIETVSSSYYNVDTTVGKVWLHSDRLSNGVGNVTAVYSCGYGAQGSTDIPQDLFFMGLELLKLVYNEKTQGIVQATAIQIGPHSIQLNPSWPKQIKQTLDSWRRIY